MMLFAAFALASAALPSQPFPRHVGDCGWVHGRFAFWSGSGIRRIWVIGTRHYLNLRDLDENVPDHRFSMRNAWPKEVYYGDFLVCAARNFVPGHMQRITLKRVKNLFVQKIRSN